MDSQPFIPSKMPPSTSSNTPSPESHSAESAPDPAAPVPGKLLGTATLTLQTQQAARLVRGRAKTSDKPAIIGLLSFAAMCRTIWHGVRADDPYADWWRLKVDGAIREARAVLDRERRSLDPLFARDGAVAVQPARSEKPVRIALNFTNPDAFRAAQVIGHFDGLACGLLSLAHAGTLGRDEARHRLERSGRAVRRVLQSAVGYRYLGLDRSAVRQGTALAVQAREVMGDCPQSLLDKAYRHPVHRPPQPGAATAGTESNSVDPDGAQSIDELAGPVGIPRVPDADSHCEDDHEP
ncbi:MAG: TIGR03761 family integrating conjugative element protein [Pseudomonadota bacterium]